MCLNVNRINRSGHYKEDCINGKKGTPYMISAWTKCGHCAECVAERSNSWVVRNYYESMKHKKKCFLTLTYKDNPKVLIKKDLQDFLKRFRYYLDKEDIKIRYFGAGEYGTKRGRPHYHLIIYGWEDIAKNLKILGYNDNGNILFQSKLVQDTWGKGRTTYQLFDDTQIPYISLYQTSKESNFKPKQHIDKFRERLEKSQNLDEKAVLERRIQFLEKQKIKYYHVKEFNIWSTSLGFEEWIKHYDGKTWKEHFLDMEIFTPSPWVKRVANMGEQSAIEEVLRRRDFEENRAETEEERKLIKSMKKHKNHSKDVLDWQEKQHLIEKDL